MWVIAKREFIERVRSKWFIVMTILWPLLMVGMIVVPAMLGGRGTAGAKVLLVDRSHQLGPAIKAGLELDEAHLGLGWKVTDVPADSDENDLRRRIRTNEINGYLVIAKDAIDG